MNELKIIIFYYLFSFFYFIIFKVKLRTIAFL